jgi:tetratricopeptide (TPR) repeat protein
LVSCSAQPWGLAQDAGLGRIDFPTSQSGEVQQRFLKGVLFLHSFQYTEARREFLAAREAAPDFAMAYWGEAMTYNEPLWFAQNADAARAALQRLGVAPKERRAKAGTEREAAYLNAVEILYGPGSKEERDFKYAAAMQRLHEGYPADDEAAAFYALALLGISHRGRNFRIYMQAAAIAEEVLARNPEHPGALHYAIHSYDDPVHAPLGLRAARQYAKVAPESSHALHMPSHIFFAMGMWQDAVRSNQQAFRASQRSAERTGEPIEAGGYHALWWLQYAYLQQGKYAAARKVLEQMEQFATGAPTPLGRFHLAQMRAMYAVETGEPHDASTGLTNLDPDAIAAHWLAAGLTAMPRGNRKQAETALASLRELKGTNRTASHDVHAGHSYPGDTQIVTIMEYQLAATLLLADGKSREAIESMKAAVALEDKTPYEFGPPSPPKPAHELLGEMLLSLGQPKLARTQFELALLRAPKRALSMLGLARAYSEMGDVAAAKDAYMRLREMWSGADPSILKALDDSVARLQGADRKRTAP